MSGNPYAPPQAPLDLAPAVDTQLTRPREVVWAVQLAVANYLIGLATIAVTWEYFSRLQSLGRTFVTQTISIVVLAWLYYKIYQGRNWARIVWLVLTALGLLVMPMAYRMLTAQAPVVIKWQMFSSTGMSIATIWLLFFSAGRLWFRSSAARP